MLKRRGLGVPFARYRAADGEEVDAWLTATDLRSHALLVGSTGSGKSSLLETLARYHFRRRQGLCLLDLHGDTFQRVTGSAIAAGVPRLTLLDFTRPETLPSWNPLVRMPGVDTGRQVNLLISVLKRLFAGERAAASWSWGVAVEELMRFGLTACIESQVPVAFAQLREFFLVPAFRRQVLATVSEATHAFFAAWGPREDMYLKGVMNRLDPLLGSEAVRAFLGAKESSVDPFRVVQRGETLLVNLARGNLGPSADVLGRLLMNALQLAALKREAVPREQRTPFSLLLDEAHVLATPESGLEDLLVAGRKFRVYVTLAAQSLSLFPRGFRPHLLGNTQRQFFFRLPFEEARELAPDITEPLGNVKREQLRPYDALDDPLLAGPEEMAARAKELSNLPVGACYWVIRGRPFKGRRIQLHPAKKPPFTLAEYRKSQAKVAKYAAPRDDEIVIPSRPTS